MFRSFFLAGFECATGWNRHRQWIDQIAATGHDVHLEEDYDRLAEAGIHAVREGIRWPLVDRGGQLDFSSVEPFVRAARHRGFDVIWDLFHYGFPDDVDPFGPAFVPRFERYCHAVAQFIGCHAPPPHYFTPVNEPSYFSWAGAEAGLFAPHAHGRGFELKLALARAAVRGIDAIRAALPQARIVNVDPICRVVPRPGVADDVEHARRFNTEWMYEFWDMVSGRTHRELGGSPAHLDIVGLNYYWTNQWELGSAGRPLADDDPRRVPLAQLVRQAWRRYGADVVISETSALGEARAPWIGELAGMAAQLLAEGVPLHGICLYPVLGMPEWHAQDEWTRMGLWDIDCQPDGLQRTACVRSLQALRHAQQALDAMPVMTERPLQVPHTGGPVHQFVGELLWERRDPSGLALRVFRADRPYRLWIAAMEVQAGAGRISHVSTSAQLALLLQSLRRLSPAEVARSHGVRGGPLPDDAGWTDIRGELERSAAHLESVRLRPAGPPVAPAWPVMGGGRR